MKKLLSFFAFLLPLTVLAQSVAINTDGTQPDNSSILDIKSSSKGLLIPRMNSATRTAIAAPAIGLTVFDTETSSHWIYRGDLNGGWSELQHSFQNYWMASGTDIHTKLNGNVGIGTSMPASKLTIDGTDPVIGIRNNGLANGYIQALGTHMQVGTSPDNATGKLILGTKGNDHFNIDHLGRVSFGTSSLFDANLKLNGTSPIFGFLNNDVQKGFIRVAGDNFKVGTYPGNPGSLVFSPKNVDKVWIDEDGKVGIGTSTPSSVLTVNGTEPIIQMRNGNVDKGFMQLVGNHLRVGTNASNTIGSFIVRTNSDDRVYVNHKGQMGLNNVPDDTETTLTIGEDDNGNSGVALIHGNVRRGMFNYNGSSTFLTASTGYLYLYRNSSYPLVFHPDGNYSMGGHTTANGYRLSVYGKAIAYEFTALAQNNWPDYVFEKDYRLMPLSELKQFIAQNKHLPSIPRATQMEKDGIPLGEMTRKLMEKVEELTLYVIQQQEQIDALKKELQQKR